MNTYFVAWYSDSGSHKKWGVYKKDTENTLMCVCLYKRGAIRVASELNMLADWRVKE